MSALDQGPATAPVPSQAAARPAAHPAVLPAVLPRDPRERLAALFDPGTLEVLPVETGERSGAVAGTGLVHGVSAVAFASDARVQGGAMGTAWELATRQGASGAFFNGMLTTALATPCTAPFLAPALGYAFIQPLRAVPVRDFPDERVRQLMLQHLRHFPRDAV